MLGNSPPPRSIFTISSTPVSVTRSPATETDVQILKGVRIDAQRETSNDEYSPDGMKSILKLVHPTSFLDEMFNGVEVVIFAWFKALGVVQDEMCIRFVRKCSIDIGLPWTPMRYLLLDEAINSSK